METEFDEEGEDEESDADDFIVDDDGRPITEKKKKVNTIMAFQLIYIGEIKYAHGTIKSMKINSSIRRVEFSTM